MGPAGQTVARRRAVARRLLRLPRRLARVGRVITSAQNQTLKLVRKLHARRWREKLSLFVAEGEDLVDAALEAGLEPVELLVAGETADRARCARRPAAARARVLRSDRLRRRLGARRAARRRACAV